MEVGCFSSILGRRKPRKRQICQSIGDVNGLQNIKIFSYNQLKHATGNFSPENKIGKGGFGTVFKGRLKNGSVVAVKVLSDDSKQGVQEFLNEITVISNIRHENLVKLLGCCVENGHRILVYNYVQNNSLAQTLLELLPGSSIRIDWRTRWKICVGVARGLAFLHEEVQPPVVHRDIKASNILLDEDLNPQISDFGLAKLFPSNISHISTRVAGTLGYLAPEYAIRGQLTKKADIYSFGVVLLEVVSGRCNANSRLPYGDRFLLERVWALYERGELISIVDSELNDDYDEEEALKFLKVALLCVQDKAKIRPSMSDVVKMLTGEIAVGVEIKKPGLITDLMDLKIRDNR